jgi:hypothetical protein
MFLKKKIFRTMGAFSRHSEYTLESIVPVHFEFYPLGTS